MNLLSLPPEMIDHILPHCGAKDICCFERASKACLVHANDEKLWEQCVKNDFPNDYHHKPDNLTWKAWYGQIVELHNSFKYQYRMQVSLPAQNSRQNAAIHGDLAGRSVGRVGGEIIIGASLAVLLAPQLFALMETIAKQHGQDFRVPAIVQEWNTFVQEPVLMTLINFSMPALFAFLLPRPLLMTKAAAVGSSVCARLFGSTAAIFVSIKPLTQITYGQIKKSVKKITRGARATTMKAMIIATTLFCLLAGLWQASRASG